MNVRDSMQLSLITHIHNSYWYQNIFFLIFAEFVFKIHPQQCTILTMIHQSRQFYC